MHTLNRPASPTPIRPSRQSPRRRLFSSVDRQQALWALFAVVVGAAVLLPLIPLQAEAWGNGADGFRRLVEMRGLGDLIRTTLFLGIGAMLVGLVVGTGLALCMYSMTPRMRSILEFTPVIPLLMPSVAHVVGFVFLFSPENGYVNSFLRATPFFDGESGPINVYTVEWITIYTGIHLSAFVYLFVYSGLKNLGSDYALAARVNGASGFRVLTKVTLPMLRPVFIYAAIVVTILALGQFTGPLILGRREGIDVLTTKMYEVSAEYPIDYALASALGTPLIILAVVMVLFQRKMVGNQKRFVGQGASSIDKRELNPVRKWMAASTVVGYVLLTGILPLIAITYVALSPYWAGNIDLGTLTTDNLTAALSNDALHNAVATTLVVSVVGVVLVLPIGMLIALGLYNQDKLWRPVRILLDVFANLPLTVPAALLGFGFLLAMSNPSIGLYGTKVSLILAYVIIMIPYSVRYQLTTLIALGNGTVEASQVSGAGPLRTFFQVILPLSRAGIVSAAAIMFVLLTHEFGVSLLLRAPDVSVLSVVLFDQYNSGSYPNVAVLALVMTVLTAIGVAGAMFFGGRSALEKL